MGRIIAESFEKQYDDIYLLRNELFFKLFNFDNGDGFSPDFVLFLKKKNGEELTYQIFIEPKGEYLEKQDKEKESFLLKIKDMFASKGLVEFVETHKYRIIGLPFFNSLEENKFKEELLSSLKNK
jgi:type III restriction enzyme